MSDREISSLYFELANQTTDRRHKKYLLDLGRKHQEPVDAPLCRTGEAAIRARLINESKPEGTCK